MKCVSFYLLKIKRQRYYANYNYWELILLIIITTVCSVTYDWCQLHIIFYPKILYQYVNKITAGRQCNFRRNGSTTDHILTFVKEFIKDGNAIWQCVSCSWSWRKPMIQVRGRFCIIFSWRSAGPWICLFELKCT